MAITAAPPKTEMNPLVSNRVFIACSFRGKPNRCTGLYSGLDERTMNDPWRAQRPRARPTLRALGSPGMLGLPDGVNTCLFDLDGVLTQTAKVHAAAWKQMFDQYLKQRAERT